MEMTEDKWIDSIDIKSFLKTAWGTSGFKAPTFIQKQAIPLILEGKDVIAESPTGSGKTLAYLVPLLNKIDPEKKELQVVVLAPSHELVMQILGVIQNWTKGTTIRSEGIIGGANIKRQVENLRSHPHIIVASTGRLIELIKMKKVKMHEVKTIVVDEFDVLIAQEHVDNVKNIIKTTLRDRQLVFFSATLSDRTSQIGSEVMKDPETIIINKDEGIPSITEHYYIVCDQRDKIDYIRKIVRSSPNVKALAFINDVEKLSIISEKLKFKNMPLGILTSESSKSERKEALINFRRGKFPLLIATDVAARGLDIEGLTHVINWDLPSSPKQYIHRAGRTGRMGAQGTVVSTVTQGEENILMRMASKAEITITKKRLVQGEMADTTNRKPTSNDSKKKSSTITSKTKYQPKNNGNRNNKKK
ncbi:superfamily II DNA/RNA helicase [Natranaerovirga pectinivora]|uniref:Superfamily II DNA/RNA helicase n=1 Tax=Natranaerovirga pectinivora TaxID=682400 RepID=A0A4R3MJN7_9FIRM|nr:DEAD/DEAH box helicase [Natranaerovirga pectinivora]TCT13954.1 superfamily II DNA/RNA helicase [Natranaerovirga pectinivora]